MTSLELHGVSKAFGDRRAVQDVSLEVGQGEFFSLLGPSGCGKTTLLRIIAGFERPDAGTILIGGKDMTRIPPQGRGIGMVFQNYALFPHMNVFENVAFGLRVQRVPYREIERRVRSVLASVELEGRHQEMVAALSGGEQQRVAVARALVIEPALLLFDEPLSNLDVSLRQRTREEIRAIQRRTRIATVYVTHDQSEAMSLSERMAILKDGRIEQIGTPRGVYESPASPFVARFVGWPNVLSGTYAGAGLSLGSTLIQLPDSLTHPPPGRVIVAIPADAATLQDDQARVTFRGSVRDLEYLGMATTVTVVMGGVGLKIQCSRSGPPVKLADEVGVEIDWTRCRFFPGDDA